jgi:hypothetical protein
MSKREMFYEGKTLWQKYVNLNGYAFEPNTKGISALSKDSGHKTQYIRERINAFLEA